MKRTCLCLLILSSQLLAAGAGKSEVMVIVADGRRFTGLRAWWADLYNESHLYFALLTIILIPLSGLILGRLTGFLMSRIGIDLKSRALRES
jgi:hypothetical protein